MNVQSILLVGVRAIRSIQVTGLHAHNQQGFGESPYLQRRLREAFPAQRVVTADEPSKKAVAEGGALFYSHDKVVARGTRFEFGVPTMRCVSFFSHPLARG